MNSRNKGARGEREFAAFLQEHGIDARRGCQNAGGPDSPDVKTALDEYFHFEVKRVERLNLSDAFNQADDDCGPGKMPVVAHRKNREAWMVTMTAADFLHILDYAGYIYRRTNDETEMGDGHCGACSCHGNPDRLQPKHSH